MEHRFLVSTQYLICMLYIYADMHQTMWFLEALNLLDRQRPLEATEHTTIFVRDTNYFQN